ncbi:MAG: AAA family ATPase [Candidatus Hodarchaeales archaeon]|jgi:dephospho-CoA kinase
MITISSEKQGTNGLKLIDGINIVGLAGKMGSGKDTFAEWLIKHGVVVETMAFAAAVRYVAEYLFGIDPRSRDPKARNILQQVGSKIREINFDVWVNKVARDYEEKIYPKKIAITDVRHVNEADWVIESGNLLILLECPSELRRIRISERDFKGESIPDEQWNSWHSHESEYRVDSIFEKYRNNERMINIEQSTNDFVTNEQLLLEKINEFTIS